MSDGFIFKVVQVVIALILAIFLVLMLKKTKFKESISSNKWMCYNIPSNRKKCKHGEVI